MSCLVKPLASTTRTIEWEELPDSVKAIPANFNPLEDGILMKHQVEFSALAVAIKVAVKGRRTGITFAVALDKTLVAAANKEAGGRSVYYIGDTKDKGLEFIGYVAHFSTIIAQAQTQGVSSIEEFLFEDQDEEGKTKYITSYRIRFSSGFKIVALSSRPANIRGLQGDVVIDEAAFHPDVQGVLEAANALLIWGDSITIISTHNGKDNAFNRLVLDIENGLYGEDALVYRATFDDAVENGLYERVCLMTGETPTPEGKKKWYNKIRNSYGPRKAAMREELDAIPRDGGGIAIPSTWIERAMPEERPVLRLAFDDDFADQESEERSRYINDWIEEYLAPLMKQLDPNLCHILAQDYARHRHFSVIGIGEITSNLSLVVPFVIEMHKVPYNQQEQIVHYIIERLPKFTAVAFDATGNGETLAERTRDEFGKDYVHEVKLNTNWYGTWAPKLVNIFEEGFIDIPRDANLAQDLRQIVYIEGIPRVPAIEKKDLKDPELVRHADSAAMFMLLRFAMLNQFTTPFSFKSTGVRRASAIENAAKITTKGWGTVSSGTNYGGYND